MKEFDILPVRVVEEAPWGVYVRPAAGRSAERAFIDKFKLPQWLERGDFPASGSILVATVLDATREPVRMSSLDADIEVAQRRAAG